MVAHHRVLVAEDQASLRLLLTATLQRADLGVTTVADGHAALEAARRDRPDLLLLDVGLPKLDGYDVCRRLKATPETANITVVLVTARGQPQERATGLAAGADDYLVKPFSPAQLLTAVRGWLGQTEASSVLAQDGLAAQPSSTPARRQP